MYSFNFNKTYNATKQNQFKPQVKLTGANQTIGDLTFHVLPLAKNQLLFRIENLADNLDANASSVKYVNIQRLAKQFYKEANPAAKKEPTVKISETSLTHNQLQSALEARRKQFQWKGADDSTSLQLSVKRPKDKDPVTGAAFEAQRIRTYVVEYNPKALKIAAGKAKAKVANSTAPVQKNASLPFKPADIIKKKVPLPAAKVNAKPPAENSVIKQVIPIASVNVSSVTNSTEAPQPVVNASDPATAPVANTTEAAAPAATVAPAAVNASASSTEEVPAVQQPVPEPLPVVVKKGTPFVANPVAAKPKAAKPKKADPLPEEVDDLAQQASKSSKSETIAPLQEFELVKV